MVAISQYLNPKLVQFLDVETRDEALNALVDLCDSEELLNQRDEFFDAVLQRERIVSTGIGMGVAIPHAKLPSYNDFFIAIGISRRGLDWNSLDKHPVRLIFLIGGPDDKQTEYLQILSGLTLAIKDEARRKQLLRLDSPEAIVELFKDF